MPQYRFGDFTLSPRRRLLLQGHRELPLIPRYFDLLVFLLERRHEAVHRRDIFDHVWSDVVVSDSALSQAVRTLRRALGDDPREPRFIRTVSRHGYRFMYAEVVEEEDGAALPADADLSSAGSPAPPDDGDPFEPLLERLTRQPGTDGDDEDRLEAAEMLHALGTAGALRRLGTRPGHAVARALLREARWVSPSAGDVPVLGGPAPVSVARELVAWRIRRARRMIAARWAGASAGGGAAGVIAGAAGGLLLAALPGSSSPAAVAAVLAVIGGGCGAIGGAGIGAGLAMAEATIRSRRTVAFTCGAALGGGIAGFGVQCLARWGLAALVGLSIDIGGGVEGIAIGGAFGLGYAIATAGVQGGPAAPRGRQRVRAAAITAAFCGAVACALTLTGRPLVGGTVHAIAREARGSQITLAPLSRLIGEPDFGRLSQTVLGVGEGAIFGFGAALGLMRRPSSRRSHKTVTAR